MSPCKGYNYQLQDYVDRELTPGEMASVDAHLKVCPECAGYVHQIISLKGHLRALPEIKSTENFHLLLRERIRREMASQQRKSAASFVWTHRIAPAAGFALVILAAGSYLMRDRIPFLGGGGPTPVAEAPASFMSNGTLQKPSRVKYVIDEYGDAVSLDRKDSPAFRRQAASDSTRPVPQAGRRRGPLRRAVQVSF